MKYLAAQKLFLANGATVQIGGTVPDFEKWPEVEREAHMKSGMVRAFDERTGKDSAPHTTKTGTGSTHPVSVSIAGQRKASPIRRKG